MINRFMHLIVVVWLVSIVACRPDAVKPASKVTVVGKWFIVQHDLKVIKDGVQVDENVRTNYTKDDFAQFFEDGSGYQSAGGTTGASLSTFKYTLSGTMLTLYITGDQGVAETITKLTESDFSIHYVGQIADPSNSGKFNTEIDDYTFKR